MTDLRSHSDTELLHHNQTSLDELDVVLRRETGEFALTLAACNYNRLRHLIVAHFTRMNRAMVLPLPSNITSLIHIIHSHVGDTQPPALMVTGLELLPETALIAVLKGANLSRDEFRKHFPFPIVLWMTERVRQQFARHAPDFRSFSPSAIAFTLPPGELLHALHAGTNQLFFTILERQSGRDLTPTHLRLRGSPVLRSELEFANQDLIANDYTPDPDLEASLDFLRGQEAHSRMQMTLARECYERSLAHWHHQVDTNHPTAVPPDPLTPTPADKQAVLWLYLGFWWRHYAMVQRVNYYPSLRRARQYFTELLQYLRDEDSIERQACFIHTLSEVLQKQRDWQSLEEQAVKGVTLHQQTQDPIRLARDRGYLAEVALIREDWLTAYSEAEQALALLQTAQDALDANPEDIELANTLAVANSFQRGWYRFLLGSALVQLAPTPDESDQALQYLEAARWETDPAVDRTLHLQVLEELIEHYFAMGRYWEAFDVKQELRQVEYRYNLRAFVGAGAVQPHQRTTVAQRLDESTHAAVAAEIQASGRLQDVEALVKRLEDKRYPLIVIHGPSGVGKSSILSAGLQPAVRNLYPQGRTTLSILVQTYSNWQQGIASELAKALNPWRDLETSPLPETDFSDIPSPADLIADLRFGVNKNRFFILIFDQFEEFFFDKMELAERRIFYAFLQQCIDQPWVKVVLALREDYLHHLLEVERIINQVSPMAGAESLDMLSRDVRYPLANFTSAAAEAVIRQLTTAAQYPLENTLIHRLVTDLAAETGDVRPIELQVVGAQLQRQDIHTLGNYEALGESPKETLVQEFLAYVVHDCGPPNERLAWVVLYLFTDEDRDQRLYRPFKTREELEYELSLLEMPFELQQLSMVLSILVGSGLVFEIPEEPEDRYQLVHDYLVRYVRNVQTPGLMEELEMARAAAKAAAAARDVAEIERDKLAEANAILAAANQEARVVVGRAQKRAGIIGGIAATGVIAAIIASIILGAEAREARRTLREAEVATVEAEKQKLDVDIQRRATEVELLIGSKLQFAALKTATELGRNLQRDNPLSLSPTESSSLPLTRAYRPNSFANTISGSTRIKAISALREVIYLPGYLEQNTFRGHTSEVYTARFSPDGQMIASASKDGTVKLWSHQGQVVKTLRGHTREVIGVEFSPDGATIATASGDRTVKLWQTTSGQELRTLIGHANEVIGVSFSPDGQAMATASRDGTIRLWDASNGTPLKTLDSHTDQVWQVRFSPDGQTLASASKDGTIKLWDVNSGQEQHTLNSHEGEVWSVSFAPDGQTLASASGDATIKLWDVNSGQEQQTLAGHSGTVWSVSFAPDGQTLASASSDATIKLWDVSSGEEQQTLAGHSSTVWSVSFAPGHRDTLDASGSMLISASLDGTVKLWNYQAAPLKTLGTSTNQAYGVSFSPSGDILATADNDGTVELWNRQGARLHTLSGHTSRVWDISFSPDRQRIATASLDGTVKIWNPQGQLLTTLSGHTNEVYDVTFAPDGDILASAGGDGTVKIWNPQGQLLQTLTGHDREVWSVSFAPDGQTVASASGDGTVKLWHPQGEELQTLKGHSREVYGVSFAPDGQAIASASRDGTIKLWTPQGELLNTLPGYSRAVYDVSFAPDSQTIVSASGDGTVKLWNRQGQELQVLEGHSGKVNTISFAPDGQTIASADNDGTVILWNFDLDDLLNKSCIWLHSYIHNPMTPESEQQALCPDAQASTQEDAHRMPPWQQILSWLLPW